MTPTTVQWKERERRGDVPGRLLGGGLGAVAGLAFSTVGLIEIRDQGVFLTGGGNEATPLIIGVLVIGGAALGATILRRVPAAIAGATIGLWLGMYLRDQDQFDPVQPPEVFLLLFGLPLLGAGLGYLFHRIRDFSAS